MGNPHSQECSVDHTPEKPVVSISAAELQPASAPERLDQLRQISLLTVVGAGAVPGLPKLAVEDNLKPLYANSGVPLYSLQGRLFTDGTNSSGTVGDTTRYLPATTNGLQTYLSSLSTPIVKASDVQTDGTVTRSACATPSEQQTATTQDSNSRTIGEPLKVVLPAGEPVKVALAADVQSGITLAALRSEVPAGTLTTATLDALVTPTNQTKLDLASQVVCEALTRLPEPGPTSVATRSSDLGSIAASRLPVQADQPIVVLDNQGKIVAPVSPVIVAAETCIPSMPSPRLEPITASAGIEPVVSTSPVIEAAVPVTPIARIEPGSIATTEVIAQPQPHQLITPSNQSVELLTQTAIPVFRTAAAEVDATRAPVEAKDPLKVEPVAAQSDVVARQSDVVARQSDVVARLLETPSGIQQLLERTDKGLTVTGGDPLALRIPGRSETESAFSEMMITNLLRTERKAGDDITVTPAAFNPAPVAQAQEKPVVEGQRAIISKEELVVPQLMAGTAMNVVLHEGDRLGNESAEGPKHHKVPGTTITSELEQPVNGHQGHNEHHGSLHGHHGRHHYKSGSDAFAVYRPEQATPYAHINQPIYLGDGTKVDSQKITSLAMNFRPSAPRRFMTGAEIALGVVLVAGAISKAKDRSNGQQDSADGKDNGISPDDTFLLSKIAAGNTTRATWLVGPGDTLTSLAERFYEDAHIGYLIAAINADCTMQHKLDGKLVVQMYTRQTIHMPNKDDVDQFYGRRQSLKPENLITIVTEREFDRQMVNMVLNRAMGVSSQEAQNPSYPLPVLVATGASARVSQDNAEADRDNSNPQVPPQFGSGAITLEGFISYLRSKYQPVKGAAARAQLSMRSKFEF